MSPYNVEEDEEGIQPEPSPPPQSSRSATLVIVSQQGRHSDEARRIVRAQAARSSAAQSRVTRAKNRETRNESTGNNAHSPTRRKSRRASIHETGPRKTRERTLSKSLADSSQASWSPADNVAGHCSNHLSSRLTIWIQNLLHSKSASINPMPSTTSTTPFSEPKGTTRDQGRPQLPMAIPRGFSTLHQRIHISDMLVSLISRTSCFDYESVGVEDRLQQLLHDLISNNSEDSASILTRNEFPQDYIRIACICLVIFQSQRVIGAISHFENTYRDGLDAAWSEAIALDRAIPDTAHSADPLLWALLVITVTAGATSTFFDATLNRLINHLDCRNWDQMRNILVEFIYPSYYLDGPCKDLLYRLRNHNVGNPLMEV